MAPSKSQTAKRKQAAAQAQTVPVEAKKAKQQDNAGLAKKVVITVICVILALAMTIPSMVLLFSR